MSEINDGARKPNASDCPDDFCAEGTKGGSEESADASVRTADEADLKDGRDFGAALDSGDTDETPPLKPGKSDVDGNETALDSSSEEANEADGESLGAGTQDGGKRSSLFKRVMIGVVTLGCLLVMLFIWYGSTFALVPDVMGMTPSEAEGTIGGVSGNWKVSLEPNDDISGLNVEDLDLMYEVCDIEPSIGETLNKGDVQTFVIHLQKNAETIEAERRLAIIQKEIEDSLSNGWLSEEYIDEGDVVVFKVTDPGPLVDAEHHISSPAISKRLDNASYEGYYLGNQALYERMAEQLESNVVTLCYSSDGYLTTIFAAMYSHTSEESVKRAATFAREAQREHIEKVSNNLQAFVDGYIGGIYENFPHEFSMENGLATVYLYGNGFVHNGNDISNSSAEIEKCLFMGASDIAYFLQAPTTVKFIKNGALFASATAEPESFSFGH